MSNGTSDDPQDAVGDLCTSVVATVLSSVDDLAHTVHDLMRVGPAVMVAATVVVTAVISVVPMPTVMIATMISMVPVATVVVAAVRVRVAVRGVAVTARVVGLGLGEGRSNRDESCSDEGERGDACLGHFVHQFLFSGGKEELYVSLIRSWESLPKMRQPVRIFLDAIGWGVNCVRLAGIPPPRGPSSMRASNCTLRPEGGLAEPPGIDSPAPYRLHSEVDSGAKLLVAAWRIGKTVQFRCGPAAVTGDDTLTMPLQVRRFSPAWEGKGRGRSGSQKTCPVVGR